MNSLAVETKSIVFHDDGSIEIIYQESRDNQNGVLRTQMLQFRGDLYLARVRAFMEDCQDFIDDMLVVQREGPPE